ncbi:hypothetical protein OBBRIDRAFT_641883 [Obba rivulosa]|uniref:Uncharacterized protein n=1 Tax=Obba rivulosa TaxID=1052685 RepID=A0A8E2J7D8_9APHY|nr:hypothetical protein OBBRIDRAFT_641883 [Obba rivulosa]
MTARPCSCSILEHPYMARTQYNCRICACLPMSPAGNTSPSGTRNSHSISDPLSLHLSRTSDSLLRRRRPASAPCPVPSSPCFVDIYASAYICISPPPSPYLLQYIPVLSIILSCGAHRARLHHAGTDGRIAMARRRGTLCATTRSCAPRLCRYLLRHLAASPLRLVLAARATFRCPTLLHCICCFSSCFGSFGISRVFIVILPTFPFVTNTASCIY